MPTRMNRISMFAQQVRDKVSVSIRPRMPSTLDFQDANPPNNNNNYPFNNAEYGYTSSQVAGMASQSGGPPGVPLVNNGGGITPLPPKTPEMRRNKTEAKRLPGLMQRRNAADTGSIVSNTEQEWGVASRDTQTSAPTPETRMERLRHWFINEGGRRTFFAFWLLVHALVFAFGFVHYTLKDNLSTARATFGWTYPVARSAALVLHVEVAILLLPICRNFITLIRRTQLNSIIPFDANITFHKSIGWGIFVFSTLHTLAHMRNFYRFAVVTKTGVVGFLMANFATGPGVTGWIMTIVLCIMIWFAIEKRRRAHFNRFWYSHHLFIIFFAMWQLHGMFCMIPNDNTTKCDYWQVGVFWKYFLVSGIIYVYERLLREFRSRHKTFISKVIEHPGGVVEVQIKKEKTTTKAGQYIFINCPDISYWQWHPFTLTSAPEEEFISVNIKMVGDWTKAFGKALGCGSEGGGKKEKGGGERVDNVLMVDAPIKKVMPRMMVDGPFGSASEDYHKFEVVMLCAAGIGVTPFASILKSIWYRLNYPQPGNRTRLSKVYFIHICRDTASVSWFKSLLAAIEAQDTNGSIEIMTYVTQKMKDDDLHNIMVTDVGSEKDAISGLRAPTHYGRPNWDKIFSSVRDKHPNTDVGTLFCGPKSLGSTLHKMCNKWSSGDEDGTKFIFGKENF